MVEDTEKRPTETAREGSRENYWTGVRSPPSPLNTKRENMFKHWMTVLIDNGGDCTNGGISRKLGRIQVVVIRDNNGHLPHYGDVEEVIAKNKIIQDDESLILCTPRSGPPCMDNPPAAKWIKPAANGEWTMFGGSYVTSSNTLVHQAIGYNKPIAIHDRVEKYQGHHQ